MTDSNRSSTPGTVTADRGYGEAKVDRQITDLGVKNVVIPRKGKPPRPGAPTNTDSLPTNNQVAHRKRRPHRTLKRGYGWDRPASTAPKAPESGPGTAS